MNLRPTHQLKDFPHSDVTAWRYDRKAPIPMWVARRFHNLGDGRLTALARDGSTVQMHEGDWVVTDGNSAFVLTDAEFTGIFHGLPQAAGRPEGEAMPNAS